MKKFILSLIVLAWVGGANAVLLNNGDFESPLGPGAGWSVWAGGPVAAIEQMSGGNPGQFVSLNNGIGGWAGWYNQNGIGGELNVLGIPAGTTITFEADMKSLGGVLNAAGLKAESWDEGGQIHASAEPLFTITTVWETYSIDYTLRPETTYFVISLMNLASDVGAAAHIGYDNARISIPGGTPALKPVPIVGGTLPAVNDVLSWTNPDPNNPADTITADVFILESDTLIVKDPNLGPTILDPGVVMVANDITAESLDLSDAGYTLQVGKYYYWAVHISDPEIGVVEGFDWYFLATGDAPPSEVSAGVDQYVWLDGGTNQFTLTGTYTDDGKSPVTVEWVDLSNPLEQAPGTTVTINSPNTAVTTVDVDGDGWFLFSFTVTDAVGSGSDTVNVGVYVDACAAAYADPDDIQTAYPDGTGDIDGDCDIDLDDFALMAATWMDCLSDKLGCIP